MKKAGPFITLFIVLVLPLVIYLVLRLGTTQVVKPLRIISEKIADPGGGPDSVYKAVDNFAFPGHTGDTVTLDSFRGRIWVANVFSSECKKPCPLVSQGVATVQDYYKDDPGIRFLSISIDPVNDSLPALREFASDRKVIDYKWFLITGEPEPIRRFAREEFGFQGSTDDPAAPVKMDNTLRLVDREGRFRGYHYDATRTTDIDSLISHIRVLQREYKQAK